MIVKIQPSEVSGNIYAPASKSSMQRACAAALLSNSETVINNPGKSNDDLAALEVIQKLGATITHRDNNNLLVKGSSLAPGPLPKTETINCGESGLGLRMFAPIAALNNYKIILTGNGSLLQRPMDFFDDIFPKLGISIQSNNGKLPIKIKGPLIPSNITIDGSLSSQFLTGLLMAYTKACTTPVSIKVESLKSKPYIDLTLQVMKHFGWEVENKDYKEFLFKPATDNKLSLVNYTVEGDWSSAAFLLVAGVISGSVMIDGLDINSAQADKAIMKALELSGTGISSTGTKISIRQGDLKPFYFNATECPDLFPPLVALASYCKGESTIKGVHRLKHKESNRAVALKEEFGKMGIEIKVQNDDMIIKGGTEIKGAEVHSHHDHRIAMACAVTALRANGDTSIYDAEAVNKSYPGFYDDLKRLNVELQKS